MADKTVTLLDAGEGRLAALAPYSDDFVRLMRAIPGARWNPKAMRWEFPAEGGRVFRHLFATWIILSSEAAHAPQESRCLPPAIAASLSDAFRAMKYSRSTADRYISIADRYARFLEIPLVESGAADATRFLASLERDLDSSASTINQAISALRFLYRRVLGREVPLTKRPKSDRRLPGVLSRDEAMRLVSAPRNLKHRALLVLAYSAGLRVSEIAALRVSDVDPGRGVILVRCGKGRKDRYTILATKTKKLLETYIDLYKPKEWLFEGQKGGHLSTRSVQEVFGRAKEKVGITKEVFSVKRNSRDSPHELPGKHHGKFPAFTIGNNRV